MTEALSHLAGCLLCPSTGPKTFAESGRLDKGTSCRAGSRADGLYRKKNGCPFFFFLFVPSNILAHHCLDTDCLHIRNRAIAVTCIDIDRSRGIDYHFGFESQ